MGADGCGASSAIFQQRFAAYPQPRTAIFDYLGTFYNRTRLHSSLAYMSSLHFGIQKLNTKIDQRIDPYLTVRKINPIPAKKLATIHALAKVP